MALFRLFALLLNILLPFLNAANAEIIKLTKRSGFGYVNPLIGTANGGEYHSIC
jgi:hypothetical protein